MFNVLISATLVLSMAAVVAAQEPTCKSCPGTYIAKEEIDAYLKRAMAENIIDQQVRAVDIGKSNVAIGMVHRTKLTTPGEVAEHDFVSEVTTSSADRRRSLPVRTSSARSAGRRRTSTSES
jgi:hypothetical protein